jgi:hypothetical protein
MSDGAQERIAKNNLTFREANEKIRSKADEYDAPLERIPFLCEFPLPGCLQIVRLTLDEYSGVRANPRHFLTVPGHEQAERPLGRVVSRQDGYVVVEKDVDISTEEA